MKMNQFRSVILQRATPRHGIVSGERGRLLFTGSLAPINSDAPAVERTIQRDVPRGFMSAFTDQPAADPEYWSWICGLLDLTACSELDDPWVLCQHPHFRQFRQSLDGIA